ncbi:16804_t:CDS:1, partial [Gigaspora margarita]
MSNIYQIDLTNLLNTVNQNVEITIPIFDPTIELQAQVNAAYINIKQLLSQ